MLTPAPFYCAHCALDTPGHGHNWQVYCPACLRVIARITRQSLPFGKFKGREVHTMRSPEEQRYLNWFLSNVDIYSTELGNALYYQLGYVPLHEQPPLPDWAALLELQHPIRPEDVKGAYRTLAKRYHPDAGGSKEQMQRLNAARTQAIAHLSEPTTTTRRL